MTTLLRIVQVPLADENGEWIDLLPLVSVDDLRARVQALRSRTLTRSHVRGFDEAIDGVLALLDGGES